jgi:hypothetical protein
VGLAHYDRAVARFVPVSLFTTVGLTALLAVAAAVGCATTGSHAPEITSTGDAQAGDAPAIPPPLVGLRSISISPSTSALTLAYGSTAPATTSLTATGVFADGSSKNVTTQVQWSVRPVAATVSNGAFKTQSPGAYVVIASSGTITSNAANVVVKLTGTVNPGGIDTTKLGGTPSGSAPQIAYPLDGALFPAQLGDLAFQVVPSATSQTLGRIAFAGDLVDLDVYAPCTSIANATQAGACSLAIPPTLETSLAVVSEGSTLTETVRLAAADGSSLAESAPVSVRWSSTSLSGTIYYWSTPPMGMSGASEIIRMNLSMPGTPPEVYMTNLDVASYAPPLSGGWACIGCHAISPDGTTLGITIGGAAIQPDGNGSFFALVDVAKRQPIATRIVSSGGQLLPGGFATFSSFSADGTALAQELQGQLFLRSADANLTSQGPLFPSVNESITQPVWSFMGDRFAFSSWVPTLGIPHAYDSKDLNGNEIPGAQIWTAPVSGTTPGTPSVAVPRVTGATEYYPAFSDDSQLMVFNESSCSGPSTASADGYGASACDSYDDPSARLRLLVKGASAPMELDKASGRTTQWPSASTWTNSWPRFMPSHSTATLKGQDVTLYWVAFSTRRAYGATLAGSADGSTPPQIWFAAIAVSAGGAVMGDPSFAPVWLPQQNSATPEQLPDGGTSQTLGGNGVPTGNHVPQWVAKYVPYMPPNQ